MADQQVVQVHPSWFDWITVAALFLGPVFALFAQRALDWMRQTKQRRLNLYFTAMSFRMSWLHPDSLRALNSIDTVFDKNSDKPIREAWAKVIAHAATRIPDAQKEPEATQQWLDRLLDLRVDLYQKLGEAVGIHHDIDYIKTQFYAPQFHVDAETELIQIRRQLAKLVTDDGLKVFLTNPEN